jgi:lincosamide nucleotidyltransferase A/C/D/E
MNLADVFEVLDALESADAPHWVAGGWGVDVLVGRRTREHRDVDLALDAACERAAVEALEASGYRVETDQRPTRVELAAPGRRWVDLHPVVFDTEGVGRQPDLDGGFFLYLRGAFAVGTLQGRAVPCLSVPQQLDFRRGYTLRDVDHHDIALLEELDVRGGGR